MLLEDYREEEGLSYRKLAARLNSIARKDQEKLTHTKVERMCKNGSEIVLRGISRTPIVVEPKLPAPQWIGEGCRLKKYDERKESKIYKAKK